VPTAGAGALTLTLTVQLPPAGMPAPVSETNAAPAVVVQVPAGLQVLVGSGAAATTIAAGSTGKVSVNATPAIALLGLGLVMVKVSVLTPPLRMVDGENCFAITGGEMAVSDAVPKPVGPELVPVCVVEIGPLTLVRAPGEVAVTATESVQLPLTVPTRAGIVPPLNVNVVLAAVGAQVPPQVEVAAGVAATCKPEGSASVNAAPVSAMLFSLPRVKVSVEVAPTAIVVGLNALVSGGCCGTPQPVKTMLSMKNAAVTCRWPTALMRKVVVLEPVVAAVSARFTKGSFLKNPTVSLRVLNAPPLALE